MPEYIVKVSARGVTKYHEFKNIHDAIECYDSYKDIKVDIHFFKVTCLESSAIADSFEEPDTFSSKKKYSLEELLKDCNEENRHEELIPDRQGKELL